MDLLSWERPRGPETETSDLTKEAMRVLNVYKMLTGKSIFLWHLIIVTFDILLSLENVFCQWTVLLLTCLRGLERQCRSSCNYKGYIINLCFKFIGCNTLQSFNKALLTGHFHTRQVKDHSSLDPTWSIFVNEETLKYTLIYIALGLVRNIIGLLYKCFAQYCLCPLQIGKHEGSENPHNWTTKKTRSQHSPDSFLTVVTTTSQSKMPQKVRECFP